MGVHCGDEQRKWIDGSVIAEANGFGPVLVGETDQRNALGTCGDIELSPPLDQVVDHQQRAVADLGPEAALGRLHDPVPFRPAVEVGGAGYLRGDVDGSDHLLLAQPIEDVDGLGSHRFRDRHLGVEEKCTLLTA